MVYLPDGLRRSIKLRLPFLRCSCRKSFIIVVDNCLPKLYNFIIGFFSVYIFIFQVLHRIKSYIEVYTLLDIGLELFKALKCDLWLLIIILGQSFDSLFFGDLVFIRINIIEIFSVIRHGVHRQRCIYRELSAVVSDDRIKTKCKDHFSVDKSSVKLFKKFIVVFDGLLEGHTVKIFRALIVIFFVIRKAVIISPELKIDTVRGDYGFLFFLLMLKDCELSH